MEKRIETVANVSPSALPHSKLPTEYLKMVESAVQDHFSDSLARLKKVFPKIQIRASGRMYQDEIVLAVSFVQEGSLASPTLHASADFDPTAASPSAQDLLNSLVDAIGAGLENLFDSKRKAPFETLFEGSLSHAEDVPFEWTALDVGKRKTWIKLDMSNPDLDQMTENWLRENDPDFDKEIEKADTELMQKIQSAAAQAQPTPPAKKDKSKLH